MCVVVVVDAGSVEDTRKVKNHESHHHLLAYKQQEPQKESSRNIQGWIIKQLQSEVYELELSLRELVCLTLNSHSRRRVAITYPL